MAKRFNVRVYGILIHEDRVLVSDEFIKGNQVTKFPGGGLEFGEGTHDCVAREFREELELEVKVTEHFYTTDFFVHSAFDTSSQVISIYYLVEANGPIVIESSLTPHNYIKKEGAQAFRWLDVNAINDSHFTLIIDKKVGEMLSKKFNRSA